jgi:hypothetical protein
MGTQMHLNIGYPARLGALHNWHRPPTLQHYCSLWRVQGGPHVQVHRHGHVLARRRVVKVYHVPAQAEEEVGGTCKDEWVTLEKVLWRPCLLQDKLSLRMQPWL